MLPQTSNLNDLIGKIRADRKIRREAARRSHRLFFYVYFNHYVQYEIAPFQKEMFALTEDETVDTIVIMAFRGSAKSTIMTLSYPVWAILGKQQKKFVLIASQTRTQARQHLMNIKKELESNILLRNDLGPFETQEDEWGSFALVLRHYDAKIMAVSTEQSVRGLRHKQYRPDLIICDDVEDSASAKTREGRLKSYQWLTGEVIPAGDQNTRLVVVGNLLHEDSLLMRLMRGVEDKSFQGIARSYPLMKEGGTIAWPAKFPDMSAVEAEHRKIGSEIAWQREYLLHLIPEEDQLIPREWIQYYDELPPPDQLLFTLTGVDLAISQSDTADYTAMVTGMMCGWGDDMKVYILPNPVNERLDFEQTFERIKLIAHGIHPGYPSKVCVEDVGYQKSIIQELQKLGYPVEGFSVHGQDKRARLTLTTHLIKSGRVLFPRIGAETLVDQLVGFGVEKHDDLADAFAILVLQAINDNNGSPEIVVLV